MAFGCLADGPNDGPLALCLHGFPDTAHTFRHLLPVLADAGYRAVAPFLRGYAPTALAPDGNYQIGAVARDADALHEVMGAGDDAVLVGHDWGALATYGAAGHQPERWRKAVAMAVPPIGATAERFFTFEALKGVWYTFFFQSPFAEMAVPLDDYRFLTRLWVDWSPGYDAEWDCAHVREAIGTPERTAAAIGYYRRDVRPVAPRPRAGRRARCGDGHQRGPHLVPARGRRRVHVRVSDRRPTRVPRSGVRGRRAPRSRALLAPRTARRRQPADRRVLVRLSNLNKGPAPTRSSGEAFAHELLDRAERALGVTRPPRGSRKRPPGNGTLAQRVEKAAAALAVRALEAPLGARRSSRRGRDRGSVVRHAASDTCAATGSPRSEVLAVHSTRAPRSSIAWPNAHPFPEGTRRSANRWVSAAPRERPATARAHKRATFVSTTPTSCSNAKAKTARGVRTDPGEGTEVLQVARHAPAVTRVDGCGRPVKSEGPAVVAEARPLADHLGGARRRAGRRRREPLQERPVTLEDPGDLRLLEHHLAHEHRPRVASPAPREVPPVGLGPREERDAEGLESARREVGATHLVRARHDTAFFRDRFRRMPCGARIPPLQDGAALSNVRRALLQRRPGSLGP